MISSTANSSHATTNISKRASHITVYTNLASLPDALLGDCKRVSTVDISPLQVSTVGRSFLEDLKSLVHVDLSPLTGVTTVGAFFLSG